MPAVLCALDFSAGAAHALIRAADLAERRHADLHLVHVRPTAQPRVDREAHAGAFEDRVRAFLADALGTEEAFDVLAPTLHQPTGEAASDGILRTAEAVGADLVVMGTHGRSGLRGALVGSVAAETLRAARVPVLVVPDGAAAVPPGPGAPVLVGADFSAHTWPALEAAMGLRTAFGAQLVVAHVEAAPALVGVGAARSDDALGGLLEAVGVPGERHALRGAPADELAALAQRIGAGVLVVGTHGRRGWDRLRLGSVAEAVVRAAPCAVLIVPSLRDRPG